MADILVFEVEEGEFEFVDTHFQSSQSAQAACRPCHVVRQGRLWDPASHPISLRELYDSDQEVIDAMRPAVEKH